MSVNTAPAASSTIGLKDMVIAPLTADSETGVTYGTLQAVSGAIEATVSAGEKDPEVMYADDDEYDVVYQDPEIKFTTKMADIPLLIRKMIFGNEIDSNGVLVKNADDKPPYFAVGFKSEKANHSYRYVWLYKVRAKPMSEHYKTKARKEITRQPGTVEWTAIKRIYDGQYQVTADEGENGFTAEMGATFLSSVYAADFTESGNGESGGNGDT